MRSYSKEGKSVPYWRSEEEIELMELVESGKSIEELAEHFHRSPEAIRLKVRRMGLAIPEKQKEVSSTPTPQQTLEPLKPTEDLISEDEALKMWLGCVKRLNEPGLSATELKRIRLILQALKGYIVVSAEYVERIREVEKGLDQLRDSMIGYYEVELNRASSQEEKDMWQRKIDELKAEKKADEEWLQKPFTVWARRADRRHIEPFTIRRSQPERGE